MDQERGERVLAYTVRGMARADALLEALTNKAFVREEQGDIWGVVKRVRKESGAWPTERELGSLMQAEWTKKGHSQLVVSSYLMQVGLVYQSEVTEATWSDIHETVIRSLGAEVGAAAGITAPKDLTKKVQAIAGAMSGLETPAGMREEPVKDFLSDAYLDSCREELVTPDLRPRFFLGFPSLDLEFGGLLPGELCIIMAGIGVGKTHTLLNIAHKGMSAGKNILYIDLECSEVEIRNRLYALTTEAPTKTWDRVDVFDHFSTVLRTWTNGSHGRFLYKACPPRMTTTTKIGQIIEEVKATTRVDALMVDYGEKLIPSQVTDTRRFNEESVFEEMQALGVIHKLPVISPTQANYANLAQIEKQDNPSPLSFADLAECKAKARCATVVLGLYQGRTDITRGLIRMNFVKNRKGESRRVFMFERRFDIARIEESDVQPDGSMEPRLSASAPPPMWAPTPCNSFPSLGAPPLATLAALVPMMPIPSDFPMPEVESRRKKQTGFY